jgi:hypothetical protein
VRERGEAKQDMPKGSHFYTSQKNVKRFMTTNPMYVAVVEKA